MFQTLVKRMKINHFWFQTIVKPMKMNHFDFKPLDEGDERRAPTRLEVSRLLMQSLCENAQNTSPV